MLNRYLHSAHCDSTACLLKHFKLYSRPLWLIGSATLPPHSGVSPQWMIECVWRRSFDDTIDSDIVMTLLGRSTASVLMLMSVCSPASPATADICCTLFSRRSSSVSSRHTAGGIPPGNSKFPGNFLLV